MPLVVPQHSRLHMIMSCSSRALAALSFSYKAGFLAHGFSVMDLQR